MDSLQCLLQLTRLALTLSLEHDDIRLRVHQLPLQSADLLLFLKTGKLQVLYLKERKFRAHKRARTLSYTSILNAK